MSNESTKWLFDTLSNDNYDVGANYEEFDSLMRTNEESRRWVYETMTNNNYDVGASYEEFVSLVAPNSNPTPKPISAVQSPQGGFYDKESVIEYANSNSTSNLQATAQANQELASGEVTATPTAPSAPKAEDIAITKATATTAEVPKVELTEKPVSAVQKADGTPYDTEELQAMADKQQGSAVAEQPTVQSSAEIEAEIDEKIANQGYLSSASYEADKARLAEAKAREAEGDNVEGEDSWGSYKSRLKELYPQGDETTDKAPAPQGIGVQLPIEAPMNRYAVGYEEFAEGQVVQAIYRDAIEKNGGKPLTDAQKIELSGKMKRMSAEEVRTILGDEGMEGLRKAKEKVIEWEKKDQRNAVAINAMLEHPEMVEYLSQYTANKSAEGVAELASNAMLGSDVELGQMDMAQAAEYVAAKMSGIGYLFGQEGMDYYMEHLGTKDVKSQAMLNSAMTYTELFGGEIKLPQEAEKYVKNTFGDIMRRGQLGSDDGDARIGEALQKIETYGNVMSMLSEEDKAIVIERTNNGLAEGLKINTLADACFDRYDSTWDMVVQNAMTLKQQQGLIQGLDANLEEVKRRKEEISDWSDTAIDIATKTALGPVDILFGDVASDALRTVTNPGMAMLNYAEEYYNDANDLLNYGKESGMSGFFYGLGDALLDSRTWDFGARDMQMAIMLKYVSDKWESGEELTQEETMFMDAVATNTAAQALTKATTAYNVGSGVGYSIPYLIEMALPIKGGKTLASRLYKWALSRTEQGALKNIAKGTSKILGGLTEGALRASTIGSMRVTSGAIERMTPKIKAKVNDGGEIEFDGFEAKPDMGYGQAFGEAAWEQVANYWIERAGGDIFKILGKPKGWALDWLKKEGIEIPKNATWTDITKRMAWDGMLPEFGEEILAQIITAPVTEQTLDTNEQTGVFSKENLTTTLLTTAVLGTVLNVPNMASYRSEQTRLQKQCDVLSSSLELEMGERWESYQSMIDGATMTEMSQVMRDIANDGELSSGQKEMMLRYAVNKNAYREMMSRFEGEAMASEHTPVIETQRRIETSARMGAKISTAEEGFVSKMDEQASALVLADMLGVNSISEAQGLLMQHYGTNDATEIAMAVSQDESLTESQKEGIISHLESVAKNRAKIESIETKAKVKKEAELRQLDAISNKDMNKTVIGAMTKGSDKPVYVIAGMVTPDEGGDIVGHLSDKEVVIIDTEGNREMVDPTTLYGIKMTSWNDAVASVETRINEEAEQEWKAKNGILSQGDETTIKYTETNGEPSLTNITVDAVRYENGTEMIYFHVTGGDGTQHAMPEWDMDDLRQDAYNDTWEWGKPDPVSDAWRGEGREAMARESASAQVIEQAPQVESTEVAEEPTEQPMEISPGVAVRVGGVAGVATSFPEDGKVIVETEDGKILPYDESEVEVVGETTETTGTTMSDGTNESDGTNRPNDAKESQSTASPLGAIPVDAKGEPMYESAPVEATIADIYNDPDLDEDEADAFVQAKIDGATKRIAQLEKKKPKMGESKVAFKEAKAKWREQLEAEQASLAYWQGVQEAVPGMRRKERAKRQMEADIAQREREQQERAEQSRRAEERGRNRGDYRKAIAGWEDTPSSFHEYVAQALLVGNHKMRWNDNGSTRGLGSHTTGRRGVNRRGEVVTARNDESRAMGWLIDDRNGLSPEALADRLWNEYTGSYGEEMSEGSPLDVLLDVVTSMPTPQMMWDYVKGEHDARMEAEQGGYEEQYSEEEIEAFERDAMYREKYGVSEEEYWANEAQWDEFIESREMSAEELGNYDNFVAEERIKEEHGRRNQENAEDEQRTDNSESEGGVEVLSGTQPDITRGNEDVAGESEGVDGNGVESNDVASEESAELSEEDRQAIENMPIPTLKRQIKDTATTLFNVSQTSDQWQAENKDKIERAKLLLAYAKQELARKERLKKSNKWGIKIGNSATPFDVVRKMFEEFNSNEDLAQLFEKVAKVFETLPIKVVFSDTIGGKSTQGWFSPTTGTLKLPGHFVYGGRSLEQSKAETILHEMIHAVTTYALYINEKPHLQTDLGFRLSDDMHAAIRQLKRIYASIANDKDFKGEYGAVSVHEMIAELSNVQFREKLKKKGLWETIVDAIKQLFGITPSNALEGAEAALEYMLNNFDRSQWEKMAGMGEKRGKQMRIGVEKMVSEDIDINPLLNVVKTLYTKGKEFASKLFSRSFFDVAKTPDFMKQLGLRGDKFTIRYGVIARHVGKDGSHDLSEKDWERLPKALQTPFAITKLNNKKDSYRIYTTLQTEKGEYIVVGVEVKNAGRDLEVNAVSTAFGRRTDANLPTNEDVIYTDTNITPDQSSLLERPNFAQYPTNQELSTDKGSDNIGDVQGVEDYSAEEIKEIAREYIEDVIAESGFDAEVVDLAIYGSRRRGDAREDSDLDIVVEYSGNAREDDLFNALNDAETQLEIDGVKVDINPITKSKSGTLGEFMERAREYDEGNESNRSTKESQPLSRGATAPLSEQEGSLEDDGLLFRDGEVFYSNAEEAVRNIKQEKATPEQWLAMIQKNGGLKAGEDKWLGLSDWLNKKGKRKDERGKSVTLTKEEVLEFINQNKIKIEEVGYSQFGEGFIDEATKKLEAELKEVGWDEMENRYPGFGEYFEMYGNELVWSEEKAGIGEYEDFILDNKILTPDAQDNAINETRERYTTEGLENKKEIALVVPSVDPYNAHDEIHFGDAGGGRAVAWVRFGETTDENGNRVLVIDEIQSKRHQDGREKGYRNAEMDQKVKEAREAYIEADKAFNDFREEMKAKYNYKVEGNAEERRNARKAWKTQLTTEELIKYDTLHDKVIDARNAVDALPRLSSAVPDAPFDKNWQELAMKRMLRYAAENGYDKVAWTTGEQQAERYGMGRLFNDIEREDNPNLEGRRFVLSGANAETFQVDDNGNITASTISEAEGKSLQEVVGKEMAIKMMNLEDGDLIENEDLRIGGEGMKGFYDKMLPSFMNKYGKKWGVKVGEVTMPELQEGYQTMHSIDVTDAMRESVMEGQPMFRDGSGALSDADLSYANDPFAKALGKSQRSKAKQAKFAERERKYMRNRVAELAEKMHLDNVEVVESSQSTPSPQSGTPPKQGSGGELDNPNKTSKTTMSERKARAKGWFDTRTGKIVINISNHTSVADVERTLLHEAVAHYGLRQLFGKQFDTFLDNVYLHADAEVRAQIIELAKKHGWDFRTATEEYLAGLAEDTNFEYLEYQTSFWMKIKRFFMDMLESIGWDYKGPELSDNELRYLLWRSYENMVNPGRHRSILGKAEDVAKQYALGVGNYSTDDTAQQVADSGEVYSDEVPTADEAVESYKERFSGAKDLDIAVLNNGDEVIAYAMENGDSHEEAIEGLEHIKTKGVAGGFVPGTKKIVIFAFNGIDNIYTTLFHEHAHYAIGKLGGSKRIMSLVEELREIDPQLRRKIESEYKEGSRAEEMITCSLEAALYGNAVEDLLNALTPKARWQLEQILNIIGYEQGRDYKQETERYEIDPEGSGLARKQTRTRRRIAERGGQRSRLGRETSQKGERLSGMVERNTRTEASEGRSRQDEVGDEGILFRDGESDGTREEYNRRVRRPNRSGSVGKWDNLGWRMKEAYQDSMLSLKELQDVIAKKYGLKEIPSWMNAYLQENLMSSRNKAASDVYMRDFYNPMMKEVQALIKKGVKYEDLVNYMIAKHGLERNVVMAERDAKRAADEAKKKGEDWQKAYDEALKENRERDYSGLTALTGEESVMTAEKVAEKMVEEFEGAHETDALWEKVNAATKETLRKSYEGGLMSKETYESTEAMYEHYIPLRGWDTDIASDVYEYLMSDRPLLSPALKTAKGRTSLADDPIATIGMMADSTIAQANRNKMKQAFYYFAVNNPSDVVTISKQWYVYDEVTKKWQPRSADIPLDASSEEIATIVEEFEARMEELARDGKAKRKSQGLDLDLRTVGREGEEHTVRVKVNGEEYCIYVNGSPRAAQALNGLTNPEMFDDALMKGTKKVNNYLAQVFTSKNPEFVFSNMSRDLMWATGAVAVKENAKYNVAYHKNINKIFWSGTMPRLVHRHMMGTLNMNNELDRYFEEFVRHGGETGYTAINSIEHYKRNIKRSVKDAQGKRGMTKKAWNGVFDAIEFMNRSAENMTRFAVYVTSREMGRDQARAAHDAKEITVNFNKKGSGELGARYLGGLYVFMNACIQSMANFARLTGKHPVKMTGALATMAGLGFMLPLLNRMLAEAMGDDDEYWNLPEWVRRNNLVFRIPGTNKFITLPISHELRPFYGIGEIAYSVMNEKEDAKEGLGKAMLGFSGMSPIDFTGNGGNVAVNLTPTAFQPVAQLIANVDYFGKPIFKDADYLEDYPEYTKAYKGTSPMLVSGTEFLNRVSGGDVVVAGGIDLNPDVIEHLVESYFGGAGKTVNKAIKGFTMIWDEDTREVRNIPIVSKFLQTAEERTYGSHTQKEFYEAMDKVEDTGHKLSGYGKQATMGSIEYAEKLNELINSPEYKEYKLAMGYKSAIKKLQNSLGNIDKTKEKEVSEAIQRLQKEMLEELPNTKAQDIDTVLDNAEEVKWGAEEKVESIFGASVDDFYNRKDAVNDAKEYGDTTALKQFIESGRGKDNK